MFAPTNLRYFFSKTKRSTYTCNYFKKSRQMVLYPKIVNSQLWFDVFYLQSALHVHIGVYYLSAAYCWKSCLNLYAKSLWSQLHTHIHMTILMTEVKYNPEKTYLRGRRTQQLMMEHPEWDGFWNTNERNLPQRLLFLLLRCRVVSCRVSHFWFS